MGENNVEATEWPQRSWALAIAGAVLGLGVHSLGIYDGTAPVWRIALAAMLVVAGVAMAFVVERGRIGPSALFAIIAGIITGFTVYWNGGPQDWGNWEGWRLACALLTVAIAAPLFQAWGDGGMARPPRLTQLAYPQVHDRAWTNVVLWIACWMFTGIVWLLIYLIGQLFALIGIDAIADLMRKEWFGLMLTGGAFGAAAGVIRDRERILVTLQTVVRRVLSVLAPVLGVALIVFLLAMVVTGLSPLWEATKSTTPIVISAAIVAIILANATIGDSPEDEAKVAPLRFGAMALGAALLPLGVIAAVSTGLRIDQYGLTPDRLWAVVFTAITCAYGLAYLVSLVRARMGWATAVRQANLRLALMLCGLAFVLSTPLINFGSWSTASQLARLESGKVTPEKFDWTAMRFDFGPSGQAAVARLAKSGKTPAIKLAAVAALKLESRWEGNQEVTMAEKAIALKKRIKILPSDTVLPEALSAAIIRTDDCQSAKRCVLLYSTGSDEAIQLIQYCENCAPITNRYLRSDDEWRTSNGSNKNNGTPNEQRLRNIAFGESIGSGKISVREVKRRQVFVGDEPVGDAFE